MQGTDQEMKPTLVQPQNKEKCPRCDSFNTKFCYYNNYSLSQPRYFCKSCRRYWTQGGTLRNVPIGGGCRKAKRPKTIPSSSSAAAAVQPSPETTQNAPPFAGVETGGVFGSSCFPGGGYLPSLDAIQSALNQTAPPILMNQSAVDVGVYSFGLPEQNWVHRSFGGDGDRNPTWTAINDNNATDSSSAGNNKNLSGESENNCCNLVQNQWTHRDRDRDHLPAYGHPP